MGNCCFPRVTMNDHVLDERLKPSGKITLIYSEEFSCYIIRLDLEGYEKLFFRLWEPGKQSPYISESETVSSDSGIDGPDFDCTQ